MRVPERSGDAVRAAAYNLPSHTPRTHRRPRSPSRVISASQKALEAEQAAALEAGRLRLLERDRIEAEEVRRKGEERKRVVESQMEERKLREFIAGEEEAAREKAMIEAILAKLKAEDEAEAVSKARARDETIRAIDEFKGQRERAVAAALAAEREEAARNAAFIAAQGKREEAHKAARAGDAAEREEKYRKLVADEEERRRKQAEEVRTDRGRGCDRHSRTIFTPPPPPTHTHIHAG